MSSDASINVSALHYFHSYTLKNRVSICGLSEAFPVTPTMEAKQIALTLLPSVDDDSTIYNNFVTLVSRVLVEHLPFFKHSFDGVVSWHIPHSFSEQMKCKSDMVSIAVRALKAIVLWICLPIRRQ